MMWEKEEEGYKMVKLSFLSLNTQIEYLAASYEMLKWFRSRIFFLSPEVPYKLTLNMNVI